VCVCVCRVCTKTYVFMHVYMCMVCADNCAVVCVSRRGGGGGCSILIVTAAVEACNNEIC
jgi:hypothetical protein